MKSVFIICMDNLYYGNSAGVVRLGNYARALALANVDVYMIPGAIIPSDQKWKEVEPHIYCISQDSYFSPKGYGIIGIVKLVNSIKKQLKRVVGDVVVLNYPSTSSLLLDILLLFSLRHYPIYCEVNEVRRFASGSNNKAIRNRIYNAILEFTYGWYDGLVFISKNIQEYYSLRARKCIVVPILSNCSKSFSLSTGINSLNFVFVGTVSFPKENLEELLEGFGMFAQDHPQASLKFYGILSETDRRKLEEFINSHGMKEQVLYMGKLQHSKVDDVLSSAGGLVISRANNKQNYYGFSTKLSEYAVSGTPIIMTNTGVVSDFFKDRENCLMCSEYDRESFRIKFEELASLSEFEKKRMAENAYMVAKVRFDYKLYSNILADFLFRQDINSL